MQEQWREAQPVQHYTKNYQVLKSFCSSFRETIWEFSIKEVESSS